MSRLEVIAIETFFREGRLYRPSDRLSLPIDSAKALERSGLVRTIKAVLEDSKEIEENKKKNSWFVVASGGSLSKEDCDKVQSWKNKDQKNRGIIAVNNTYELLPQADMLIALDKMWWQHYNPTFKNTKYTVAGFKDILSTPFPRVGNSGLGGMYLAMCYGAKNIFLLGFDAKVTSNKKHFFGDHSGNLGNADNVDSWANLFKKTAIDFESINVVNCTRETAITAYPKTQLEEVLSDSRY